MITETAWRGDIGRDGEYLPGESEIWDRAYELRLQRDCETQTINPSAVQTAMEFCIDGLREDKDKFMPGDWEQYFSEGELMLA